MRLPATHPLWHALAQGTSLAAFPIAQLRQGLVEPTQRLEAMEDVFAAFQALGWRHGTPRPTWTAPIDLARQDQDATWEGPDGAGWPIARLPREDLELGLRHAWTFLDRVAMLERRMSQALPEALVA